MAFNFNNFQAEIDKIMKAQQKALESMQSKLENSQNDMMAMLNAYNGNANANVAPQEHDFKALAAKEKDEHAKRYYEEMSVAIPVLKATGLTHRQALEHADTKKIMEKYKAQPAGLMIDSNGLSNGYVRTSSKSSTTLHHNFKTVALIEKDEYTKKYYQEMDEAITVLKATGLTHPQALAHADVQTIMKKYKAHPAGLTIDKDGLSNGYSRSSSSNYSSTTSSKSFSVKLGKRKH